MGAGQLRERIEIQALTRTEDDMGGYTEAWVPLVTVWGRTWGATGNERQLASMSQGQVNRHFEIRYFSGLTEQHRVAFEGQSYNVRFVNHIKHEGKTLFDGEALIGRAGN